ncbi:hypothetical protein Taro_036512 [Colocasia esculenta]|uniref:Uncharacterized protein n=1 Tax=Colocasia esculenta TaxID=4460 RepID=A0A843W8K6_COLES|nr:hypothetical protein [Colocasia esculenta]
MHRFLEKSQTTQFIELKNPADPTRSVELNWGKPFSIIKGTTILANGLLYLRQHSRICVIYRDLKIRNILTVSSQLNLMCSSKIYRKTKSCGINIPALLHRFHGG